MIHIEGGGEFLVQMSRYVVESSVTIEGVPVPIFAWYLLICELGAVNMDNIPPGAFIEIVGALSFFWGCNDLGIVVIFISEALDPDEFAIEVGVESDMKSADV